jgi:hypothetical protein
MGKLLTLACIEESVTSNPTATTLQKKKATFNPLATTSTHQQQPALRKGDR